MILALSPLPDGTTRLSGFRFFWLRYVWGFVPHEHCQRSLLGVNDDRFTREMELGISLELRPPARCRHVYLCGVTPQAYPGLHFAFEAAPGEMAEATTYHGITVTVSDARRLPIPPREDGFAGMPHAYTSCCNWQFGVETYGLNGLQRERVHLP